MASDTAVAQPALPHLNSVERFSKLPVVEQTVDLASCLYGRVKDVNPLVKTVLSTAETTVKGAVDKTMPVATRLEGPIKMVDSILCSSLDFVETNLPAVKLPPEEMYKATKDYILGIPVVKCACELGEEGVRQAVNCACAVSEYSTYKLNNLKDSLAVAETDKKTKGLGKTEESQEEKAQTSETTENGQKQSNGNSHAFNRVTDGNQEDSSEDNQ